MSEPQVSGPAPGEAGRDEIMAALFAQMVIQQANLAMMLMGKVPHPHSGETTRDLDAARMFIDQLEMLEVKTKGNLSKDEQDLLRQSLMSLRMAFVESAESPAPAPAPAATKPAPAPDAPQAAPESCAPDAESKVKYSKKY